MSFKGVERDHQTDLAIPIPDGLGLTYGHPAELLEDRGVAASAKRALLAAWASDRCAVEGAPGLRQLESGAIVRLDDILKALKELDRPPVAVAPPKPSRPAFRLLRRPVATRTPRSNPDDDPPPRPIRMALGVRGAG